MTLKKSQNNVKDDGTLKSLEQRLSHEQKETWKTIKQGFEEMKLVKAGKLKTRPLQEVLDEL